jgi:hypothetical protein
MFQLDSGHVGGWVHQRYSRALQEYVAYEMLDRRYCYPENNLHCLWHDKENKNEGKHIQASVESKCCTVHVSYIHFRPVEETHLQLQSFLPKLMGMRD